MMAAPIDIEQVRTDTPGVESVVHFNNAGSALPPSVVLDTVVDHLRREATIGGYEAKDEAEARLDAVYDSIARLIGGRPDQVAIIENATRAWDMAVYGYPFAPGDRIVTSRAEYVSNVVAMLQLRKRVGVELVLIDDDADGQIDLAALDAELAAGAAMVAITHIPTSGGLVNPAAEVGELCRKHDVFYVLDACQSAGQVPIDVGEIGCDVLSSTGRKYLRGPRGTGFLWVSDQALDRIEPPFLDLHAAAWTEDLEYEIRPDARRFENWETYYGGKLGLGAAVDYALDIGVEAAAERIMELGELLRERLRSIDGVFVHDKGVQRCGIVTFSLASVSAEDVQQRLLAKGINTTTSGPAHARFDLGARGLDGVVRASVHYYNTADEIDALIDVVQSMSN